MPTRFALTALLVSAAALSLTFTLPARAEDSPAPAPAKVKKVVHSYDRQEEQDPPMRGSEPKPEPVAEKADKKEDKPTKAEDKADADVDAAPEKAESPRAEGVPPTKVLKVDVLELERIGTLNDPTSGGLGIDVWYGSDRAAATKAIEDAPVRSPYRTLQDLQRRLLLTPSDAEYFASGKRPEDGADLLTVRMKKLIDMGLYADASELYRRMVDEPYHLNLAENGIYALMLSGRGALACMEVNTGWNRFKDVPQWQVFRGICNLAMRGAGAALSGGADLADSKSGLLRDIAKDENFTFRPKVQKDIEKLSIDEQAAISALDAFRWDRFVFKTREKTSAAATGILLARPDIADELKFHALVRAVRIGNQSPLQVTSLFKKRTAEGKAQEGWNRLKTIRDQVLEAKSQSEKASLVIQAMELRSRYNVQGLLPFADILADLSPENFPPEMVDDGIRIMLYAGKTIPQQWVDRYALLIGNGKAGRNGLLLVLASELATDLSTKSPQKREHLAAVFEGLKNDEKALIAAIYEKLDRADKLHNITSADAYEKLIGLTQSVDYVMPSSDLTDRLRLAIKDKRLGETILLSSIALQGSKPETISPVLLGEVLDGMKTVGLTKEARGLAAEVILGLSK